MSTITKNGFVIPDYEDEADIPALVRKNIEAAERWLSAALSDFGNAVVFDITIPVSAWKRLDNGGTYQYYADVTDERIKSDLSPDITPDEASMEIAAASGICAAVNSYDGSLRLKSRRPPSGDINAVLRLFKNGVNVNVQGGGDAYVLPTATAERLGGVKIGENVSVKGDGTISVRADELLNGAVASAEDINETLDNVFGAKD